MILPQQKTFIFLKGHTPKEQDKIVNDWMEERMKAKEHVSPSPPSIIELSNGDIRATYLFAKEQK